jgi:hypothetical protein
MLDDARLNFYIETWKGNSFLISLRFAAECLARFSLDTARESHVGFSVETPPPGRNGQAARWEGFEVKFC